MLCLPLFQAHYDDKFVEPVNQAKEGSQETIAAAEKSIWREEGQKYVFETKRVRAREGTKPLPSDLWLFHFTHSCPKVLVALQKYRKCIIEYLINEL